MMDPEEFADIVAQARDWDFENETIDDSFTGNPREIDIFAIEYTAGDIWLLSAEGVSGDITVYDSAGNIVFAPQGGRFGPVEFDARFTAAESGTYYVQVRNSGFRDITFDSGPYTLSATRLFDLAGNTIETATALTLGETVSAEFEYKEDIDIFSIDVRAGQVLSFDIPDTEAIFRILDADGNVLTIQSGTGQQLQSAFFDFLFTSDRDQTIYVSLEWSLGPGGGPRPTDYDYSFTATDVTPPSLNIIDGTSGNDKLVGTEGGDDIAGFEGHDRLLGRGGHDKLFGGDGDDILGGGDGHDELFGEAGHDTLFGGHGNDLLEGGVGDDILYGGEDRDVLLGGDGHDHLYGQDGEDYLSGGQGNDRLLGGHGTDDLFGDEGADRLYGGASEDYLAGGEGDDRLYGGTENDVLDGGTGKDRLYGQSGDDALFGDGARDVLFGGDGHDLLDGGTGNDLLIGGAGADIFRFQANGGLDRILDFTLGEDLIDFSSGLIPFQDFADLKSKAVQFGDDLHLMAGDGNRLIINDFHIDDLDPDMFIFV